MLKKSFFCLSVFLSASALSNDIDLNKLIQDKLVDPNVISLPLYFRDVRYYENKPLIQAEKGSPCLFQGQSIDFHQPLFIEQEETCFKEPLDLFNHSLLEDDRKTVDPVVMKNVLSQVTAIKTESETKSLNKTIFKFYDFNRDNSGEKEQSQEEYFKDFKRVMGYLKESLEHSEKLKNTNVVSLIIPTYSSPIAREGAMLFMKLLDGAKEEKSKALKVLEEEKLPVLTEQEREKYGRLVDINNAIARKFLGEIEYYHITLSPRCHTDNIRCRWSLSTFWDYKSEYESNSSLFYKDFEGE